MNSPRIVTSHDIHGKTYEVAVDELSFRPSVYAVIVESGKVLLHGYEDGWDFPGGGIDKGEDIETALKREVFEETGMNIKVEKLLHVTSDFFMHPETKQHYHTILLFYACTTDGGTLSIDNFTDSERAHAHMPEWLPVEQAGSLKFYNPVDSPDLIRRAIEASTI